MTPPALSPFGQAPSSGWDVYALTLPGPDTLPESLPVSSAKFVCLLAWNAGNVSDATLHRLAERLLAAGCVYFCCWGNDCERVHDAIDDVLVGHGSSNGAWMNVMTTWHANESLEEAVDFFLDLACPNDTYLDACTAAVAISIGSELDAARVELAIARNLLKPPTGGPPFPPRVVRRRP